MCIVCIVSRFLFSFRFPPSKIIIGAVCVENRKTQGSNDSNPSIRLTAVFVLLLTMENWEMIENESERGGGGKREGEG